MSNLLCFAPGVPEQAMLSRKWSHCVNGFTDMRRAGGIGLCAHEARKGKEFNLKKKKEENCLAKSFSLVLGCENVVVQAQALMNF